MLRLALTLALALFFSTGCGQKPADQKPPAPPPQPTVPTPPPVATNVAPQPPPVATNVASAPPKEDRFAKRLQEAVALEKDAQFNEAMAVYRQIMTEFPGDARLQDLNDAIQRLRQARNDAMELMYAVKNLGSDQAQTVKIAQRRLLQAGETGLIFLRLALRKKESPAIAAAAAEALGEAHDLESVPLLVKWLSEEARSPLTVAIMDALGKLAPKMTRQQLCDVHYLLKEDKTLQRRELAGVFEVLYREVCGGDAAKFGEMVGDPDALQDLRNFFERSIVAGNEELITFATVYGGGFLSYLNGVRADFYGDTTFLNLIQTRFEPNVFQPNDRQFPTPGNRQDGLSIRYTGHLWIERPGEYVFYVAGDDWATVFVDGKAVAGGNWQGAEGKVSLTAGQHAFQADYIQNEGSAWVRVEWAGPGVARTAALPLRVRPWKTPVVALAESAARYGTNDVAVLRAARKNLAAGGEVGLLFLRDAVRNKSGKRFDRSLATLVEWRDGAAVSALSDRLKTEKPDSPLVPPLTRALRDLGGVLDASAARRLLARFQEAPAEMSPWAAGLCGVLDLRCDGVATNFNAFLASSNAYEQLRACVRTALAAKEDEPLLRACEYGAPFVPLIRGLRGEYFEGEEFDAKLSDRLEDTVLYYENRMPTPDNRQDKISARWSGYVQVDNSANYTFLLQAENLGHIWVRGQYIVGSDHRGRQNSGAIQLTPGLHPFAAQFQEWAGEASMVIHWEGHGIPRQPLSSAWTRTRSWRSLLEPLPAAVQALTADDEARLTQAKAQLRAADPLSRYFLRRAIRDAAEPVAAAAVAWLADLRDAETAAALVQRLKADPASATRPSTLDGLAGLADLLKTEDLAWLLAEMRKEEPPRMAAPAVALCAALEKACGGEREAFDARVGVPDAHAQLADHVARVRQGADREALARLCAYGAPFVPHVEGIRARYYEGWNRDRLVADRIEGMVGVNRDAFPHPKGRQDNVSARWEGWLHLPASGRYSLYMWNNQETDVWVDGRLVIAARGADAAWEFEHKKGLHRLLVDYRQGPGGNRYGVLHIEGQAIGQRQWIGAANLRAPLAPTEIGPLVTALDDLGADDPAKVADARAKSSARDPVSRELLRHVVRHGSEKAAAQASDLLVYRGDAPAAADLLARLRAKPEHALASSVLEGLRALAHGIPAAELPALLTALRAENPPRMGAEAAALCAVYEGVCQGSPAAFAKLVGVPDAATALRDYVIAALAVSDLDTVVRACVYGGAFVERRRGWLGRYYEGFHPDKLLLERLDGEIGMWSRQFPHPAGRQDSVSAVWNGLLDVPAPGDYSFRFNGDDYAGLWLGGKLVGETYGWQERGTLLKLEKGTYAIRYNFRQGGDQSGYVLDWEGGAIGGRVRIHAGWIRTPYTAEEVRALDAAVRDLGSKDDKLAAAARDRLPSTNRVTMALLTRAIRHEPDPVAWPAARLLLDRRDADVANLLIARLRKDPASPLASDILASVASLAERLSAENVAWLYESTPKDTTPANRPRVALLCAVLLRQCKGDRAAFDKLAGKPDAYDTLAGLIRAAASSKDDAAIAWAIAAGQPIAPSARGLGVQYFEGANFEKLVAERFEPGVGFPANQYPMPNPNQVSARWSGWLNVEKAGDYAFYVVSEPLGQLWIDGTMVVQGTVHYQEAGGRVKLEAGLHELRFDYRRWGGAFVASVQWEGPGIAKQPLPSTALRGASAGAVLNVLQSVKALGTDTEVALTEAKARLRAADPLGRLLLRKALREEPAAAVTAVARQLVEMDDADTPASIVERLKTEPAAALSRFAFEGLAGLPHRIADADLAWLLEQVKADAEGRMAAPAAALCAVLDRVCGRDAQKFGAKVKDKDAHGVLKAHVAAALRAKDTATLLRACEFGAPFVAGAMGVRAEYFEGWNLDRPFLTRIEPHIWTEQGKFPHAQPMRDNVSVRWTGWFWVPRAGDYGFYLATRHTADLWLDGAPVVAARGNDAQGAVNLQAGLHTLRVEHRVGGGGEKWIDTAWWGPDVPRQRIAGGYLSAIPDRAELDRLAAALGDLGSGDAAKAVAARVALLARDAVTRELLRNALLLAPERAAAEAVDMLAYRGDSRMATDALSMLKTNAAVSTRWSVMKAMAAGVHALEGKGLAALVEPLKAGTAPAMGAEAAALCAALRERCGGDPARFAKLTGDPKAYEALRDHVAKARAADEVETLLRACEFGAPFVAPIPGWRARYYEGFDPEGLILERVDAQIYQENQRFPHPKNRQTQVSALWEALVTAPKAGNYNFHFHGRNTARLWVDGQMVAEVWENETVKPLTLEAGTHAVRFEWRHNGGEAYTQLSWDGPDIQRQRLAAGWAGATPGRAELTRLAADVKSLADKDAAKAGAARDRLLAAGDSGVVFLRHAVRLADEPVAAQAAAVLTGLRDEAVAGLLLSRALPNLKSPFGGLAMAVAASLAENLSPETCAAFYAAAGKDLQPDNRPHVALLCAILERTAKGDKDAFGKLVGDAKAADTLAALVTEALDSKDPKTVEWACRNGGSLAPTVLGARARYYEGAFFDKVTRESVEPAVRIEQGRFPTDRKDYVSATWAAMFWAEQAGDYTIWMRADDGARIWVDGKLVVDAWSAATGQERGGVAKLARGWHTLDAAFWQTTGEHYADIGWQGPGFGRTPPAAPALRAHPTAGEFAAMADHVAKLGSADGGQVENARNALRNNGAFAALFLRRALDTATGKQLEEAAKLLRELKDASVVARVAARVTPAAGADVVAPAVAILQWSPDQLTAAQVASFLAALKDDKTFARRDLVDLLGVVLLKTCGGSPEKFDALTGTSSALGRVREYLWEAGQSKDAALAAWAKTRSETAPWKK